MVHGSFPTFPELPLLLILGSVKKHGGLLSEISCLCFPPLLYYSSLLSLPGSISVPFSIVSPKWWPVLEGQLLLTGAGLFQHHQASQLPLFFSNCPPGISSGSLGVLFSIPSDTLLLPSVSSCTDSDSTQTLCLADVLSLTACTLGSRAYTLTPSFTINVVHGFLMLLSSCFHVGLGFGKIQKL